MKEGKSYAREMSPLDVSSSSWTRSLLSLSLSFSRDVRELGRTSEALGANFAVGDYANAKATGEGFPRCDDAASRAGSSLAEVKSYMYTVATMQPRGKRRK